MTTCLSTTLTRIGGGIESSTERIGGDIACTATPIGGDIGVVTTKQGTISCAMYQVCRTNIMMRYLEISPKVVWVLAGHTENHVYSNTKWRVD